jgi:hypothetical protein
MRRSSGMVDQAVVDGVGGELGTVGDAELLRKPWATSWTIPFLRSLSRDVFNIGLDLIVRCSSGISMPFFDGDQKQIPGPRAENPAQPRGARAKCGGLSTNMCRSGISTFIINDKGEVLSTAPQIPKRILLQATAFPSSAGLPEFDAVPMGPRSS